MQHFNEVLGAQLYMLLVYPRFAVPGKTTLMKEINQQAKGEKLWDVVVMVVVFQNPSFLRTVEEILTSDTWHYLAVTSQKEVLLYGKELAREANPCHLRLCLEKNWFGNISIPFGDNMKAITLCSPFDAKNSAVKRFLKKF